ncbi:MAG: hypothetical protein R8J94_01040 [Acidimicrobiia bacterium]|nr:hypothetical protein [Acidimicrobiia bacterium]
MSSLTNVDRAHKGRDRLAPISRDLVRPIAVCIALIMITAACSSGATTETTALPTLESSTSTPEQTTADTDTAGPPDSGANDGGGAQNTDSGEEVDPEFAMAEYEKCMSDHGLDLDFASEGDGASIQTLDEVPSDALDQDGVITGDFFDEEFEAAMEECEPILEEAFGSFELTPEQEAEMADEMLEMQRCLSDEGFDIDMTGNSFALDEGIDFEAFDAAMRACGEDVQVIG